MSDDQPQTIGEAIRRAREERGITQASLAKAVGVAAETLCRYENGASKPNARTQTRIAQALKDLPLAGGHLRIPITRAVKEELERFHATGLWGITIEDVASTMLLKALREAIHR